jgi:flagellar biosynthesis/type III secretory pathway protein FliH
MNLALEVCKEESFEEGLQMGLQKGLEKGLQKGLQTGLETGKKERDVELLDLINKGYSLEQIKDTLTGMRL